MRKTLPKNDHSVLKTKVFTCNQFDNYHYYLVDKKHLELHSLLNITVLQITQKERLRPAGMNRGEKKLTAKGNVRVSKENKLTCHPDSMTPKTGQTKMWGGEKSSKLLSYLSPHRTYSLRLKFFPLLICNIPSLWKDQFLHHVSSE